MAVVTGFGTLHVDDDIALERWLAPHDLRHIVYAKHFKAKGGTLRGPVNANWMLRHSLQHEALAATMKDPRAADRLLALPGKWRTDEELAIWNARHDQLHAHIEGVMAHGG